MADITNNIVAASGTNSGLRGFGAAIMRGFERYAERASRRDRIVALEAKSDAELEAMGIRRENIAYHVFQDLFYA